jgi:hypothetical protein
MSGLMTKRLPVKRDAVAANGPKVRILQELEGSGMADSLLRATGRPLWRSSLPGRFFALHSDHLTASAYGACRKEV